MTELYILFIFLILAALTAIEAKDLLSSVIAMGAMGLGFCITFLILKAPDVAITQIVVEILCLVILIKATANRDTPFSTSGRWLLNTLITAFFIGIFMFSVTIFLKNLPSFGHPVMRVAQEYIKNGLVKTGATNLVAAVILDYRAYDALGEAAVLFTAAIGVLAITRKCGRKNDTGENADE